MIPGNLKIIFPLPGTLFPPEIVAPIISWQEKTGGIKNWYIIIRDNQDQEFVSILTEEQRWQPDHKQWEQIKCQGAVNDIYVTVLGYRKYHQMDIMW